MTWTWHDDDPATAASAQNLQTHVEMRLRSLELAGGGGGGGGPIVPFKLDDVLTLTEPGWRMPSSSQDEGYENLARSYIDGNTCYLFGDLIHIGDITPGFIELGTLDEELLPTPAGHVEHFPQLTSNEQTLLLTKCQISAVGVAGLALFSTFDAYAGLAYVTYQARYLLNSAL